MLDDGQAPTADQQPDMSGGEDPEKIRVPLDPTPAPEAAPPPAGPSESVNLLEFFKPEETSKLSMRVLDDFDEDQKSRESHMRMIRRWYELYASVMKVKNWPFQGCSNVNLPILTYAILQVHGRLFDMLLPAKGNIFNSLATRATDATEVDRAERTELYMNWYIRECIPEFRMSYDATFWQLLIFGSTFRYQWWDTMENRLCAEWVGVDDFVVNYKCKNTDPSMRGRGMRYTLVRWMSLFEIQERGIVGEYLNTEDIKPEQLSDAKESEVREVVDEVDGKERPNRQFLEDEDRQVLEQHRWLRLPDDTSRHASFDGKPHPVIVTVDEASNKVLRVVLREEDDPADRRRFDREKAAADQAQQQAAQGGVAIDQTGQMVPQPTVPTVPAPKPIRQREVCFFTHYLAFQGEGFYGLGLGNFLGPLNEAMNTLINQQIDRATVNNAGGGLVSRQLRFQRGPIIKEPGKYTEVDAPPAALKDGLQPWPQVNPDPEGRWFVTYIEQMANRVSGAGDTLSGEPVGSNETARAAMARYEQAQKQISVLAARIIGYLTCDARIMWRLFSVYLDVEEYHEVIDSQNKPRQLKIGREDFIADAKVIPTADARTTSHAQRVGEAQQFLQTVAAPDAPPELQQNPQLRRAAIERVLMAMDLHEAVDLLGPPPGPPQPPPPKPQWAENAEFLREHDQQVNQQDDDDAHLMEMQLFDQDPLGAPQLSPTAAKMYEQHRRNHYAAKLEKERQAHEQQRQQAGPLPGPQGGGPGAMEGPPPNGPPHGGPPGRGPIGGPAPSPGGPGGEPGGIGVPGGMA